MRLDARATGSAGVPAGLSDELMAQPPGTCFPGVRRCVRGAAALLMTHAGRLPGTGPRDALASLAAQGRNLLLMLLAAVRGAEVAR